MRPTLVRALIREASSFAPEMARSTSGEKSKNLRLSHLLGFAAVDLNYAK
jgi:hypothetical protein